MLKRGQQREGEAVPSQTQTAGLMMNKKERSAHKGVRGREGPGGGGGGVKKKKSERERETEREERETLFFIPQGWMKWYCKSGLLGVQIYRRSHARTFAHTFQKSTHTQINRM